MDYTRVQKFIVILCYYGCLFIQNVEGEFQIADSLTKGEFSQIIYTLNDMSQLLKDIHEHVRVKKNEIDNYKKDISLKVYKSAKKCLNEDLIHHSTILKGWSFDNCVNFTDDWNKTMGVMWEAEQLAWNIIKKAGSYGNNILNCPQLNPYKTVTCYNENLTGLKDLVANFKNTTMPLVNQGVLLAEQMRWDFDSCLGIPITSKEIIEKHLENC